MSVISAHLLYIKFLKRNLYLYCYQPKFRVQLELILGKDFSQFEGFWMLMHLANSNQ